MSKVIGRKKKALYKGDVFVHITPQKSYKYMYCGKVGEHYLLFDFESNKNKNITPFMLCEKQWLSERKSRIATQTLRPKFNKKVAEQKRQRFLQMLKEQNEDEDLYIAFN